MNRQPIELLLESLYAMPQVNADWQPFLTAVGDAFHAHVVAFHTHDVLHQQGHIDTSLGLTEGLVSKFKALSHEHPWYERGAERLLREGIADDEGLLSPRELCGTRFYGEILEPACVEHGMALVVHQDGPANMALLTINRDGKEGFYKPYERTLARTLLPHLRSAYLLQQRLGWLESQTRTFRCALDRLDDGVVLMDGHGTVFFINTAAERLASEGFFHRLADGRLRLPTQAQTQKLAAYIHSATSQTPPLSLRVYDTSGHWLGVLKACPADSVADPHWGEPRAGVILFLSRAAPALPTTYRDHWQTLWQLTRAEALLAKHLADGLSLAQAADAAGVTKNTVRTQLGSLLSKTGTHRQADLIRILLVSRP
jgi:DNA-binding CsgD family transcriptional regulator/PAS domain-containing protein